MEKRKIKLNIIDIIIIVIALLVGVFLVMKFTGIGFKNEKEVTAYITFYDEEVADYVIEKTQIGDKVFNVDASLVIGKVSEIETADPVGYFVDEDVEKMVEGSRTGYSSLSLKVKCKAIKSEYGAVVDDQLYSVGYTLVLNAGYSKYYLTVRDIEFVE